MLEIEMDQGIQHEEQGRDDQQVDDQLVQAVHEDIRNFAVLYRRYCTGVYRYLYSRTGSVHDAEDLTAQVFLDALEKLPRYRPNGTFAAWLFTIARRRAIDRLRKNHGEISTDWVEELPAAVLDPLDQVIERENLHRLGVLYQRLSEDKQELVRLRYAARLNHRQIGKIVHKSEAAVGIALRRILDRLKQNWEAPNE